MSLHSITTQLYLTPPTNLADGAGSRILPFVFLSGTVDSFVHLIPTQDQRSQTSSSYWNPCFRHVWMAGALPAVFYPNVTLPL